MNLQINSYMFFIIFFAPLLCSAMEADDSGDAHDTEYNISDEDQNALNLELLNAVQEKEIDIQEIIELLKDGAHVNYVDDYDNTPLFLAAFCTDNTKLIQLLLNWGANINQKNSGGSTPLIAAITRNNTDTALLLLENKAQINVIAKNHGTALGVALYKQNKIIIEKLLASGALPNFASLCSLWHIFKTNNTEIFQKIINSDPLAQIIYTDDSSLLTCQITQWQCLVKAAWLGLETYDMKTLEKNLTWDGPARINDALQAICLLSALHRNHFDTACYILKHNPKLVDPDFKENLAQAIAARFCQQMHQNNSTFILFKEYVEKFSEQLLSKLYNYLTNSQYYKANEKPEIPNFYTHICTAIYILITLNCKD